MTFVRLLLGFLLATAAALRETEALRQNAEELSEDLVGKEDDLSNAVLSVTDPSSGGLQRESPLELAADQMLKDFPNDAIRDQRALVLGGGIVSQHEQEEAVKSVILSADRYAVITTYAIDIMAVRDPPIEGMPGGRELSPTLKAMFEAFSQRQDDKFNFLLAYQKSDWLMNFAVGKKRTIASQTVDDEHAEENPWIMAINAYNLLVDMGKVDPEARKLKAGAQAKFWVVAMKQAGLAGAHHAKSLVNDRGLIGITGASLAHIGKDYQMDSGAFVISDALAKWELLYIYTLCDNARAISALTVKADGTPMLQRVDDSVKMSHVLLAQQSESLLRNAEIRKRARINRRSAAESQEDPLEIDDSIAKVIQPQRPSSPISAAGSIQEVILMHNPPQTSIFQQLYQRMQSKPIGKMFSNLFEYAKAGDTVKIRQQCISKEVRHMVREVLARGVNVQVLRAFSTSENDCNKLVFDMAQLPAGLELTADNMKKQRDKEQKVIGLLKAPIVRGTGGSTGKFEYRPSTGATPAFLEAHTLPSKVKRDHAKIYLLEQVEGAQVFDTIIAGTYNLDAQSIYRSSENAFTVVRSQNHDLKRVVFEELWEAAETKSDSLSTSFTSDY